MCHQICLHSVLKKYGDLCGIGLDHKNSANKKKHNIFGPFKRVPVFVKDWMKVFEEKMKNVFCKTFEMENRQSFWLINIKSRG